MEEEEKMEEVRKAAELLRGAKKVVVFTGAGISTESGIPDFRSPGGIWTKYDPDEFLYQKFISSEESRRKYWAFSKELWPVIRDSKPNPAHYAIAELWRMGKLDVVITQNVDGLHQKAGVPEDRVIELHGTAWWVVCLDCGKRFEREEVHRRLLGGEEVPRCECGGILKPATISFGQSLPPDALMEAERRSASCDLFICVGSSLVVYPAANMPIIAKRGGAKLIIINLVPTPQDGLADVVIKGKAGEVLPKIVEEVKEM